MNHLKIFCIQYCFAMSVVMIASTSAFAQTPPTARALFEKMRQSIDTIKTISYQLDYRNVNGGQEDSVFWSSSTTWAERIGRDTIFGAHFHVHQVSKNGEADYYYDGINGMDIYHKHRSRELEKTITVIEPYNLSNGFNSVQSRTTARGFSEELLSQKINDRWNKYLDSMQVKDDGDFFLIEWTQRDPKEDFTAAMEVAINKKNFLIGHIKQHSIWHSVPLNQDVLIKNLVVNKPGDADSIRLTNAYTDYTVKYDKRKRSREQSPVISSLEGSKAKEFSYTSLEGNSLKLLPKKGKYLLLDFWETWCGYCFLAMPRVRALHEKYAGKGLEVIGVVTENKLQVQKIVYAQHFPYPTVFADERVKAAYKLEGRPRYVLIDDTGTIVGDAEGDLEKIEKLIAGIFQ